MALQKQAVSINFAQGLDQKTDPNQVPLGKFALLYNSVFDKVGQLTKRFGFQELPALPDATARYITTFNGNLTAIGNKFRALSEGPGTWIDKGFIEPVQLETMTLVRNNTNQTYVDTAFSPNGLLCTAYTDVVTLGSSSTVSLQKYVIADAATGQNVIPPTEVASTFGTVSFSPKVFTLGNKFVLVFGATNGVSHRLQYQAINSFQPSSVSSVTDISTSYTPSSTGAFDGVVANDNLYVSWNGAANSGIKSAYVTNTLVVSSEAVISSATATVMSVTADTTGVTPVIWTSSYIVGSQSGSIVATNQNLTTLFSSKSFINSATATVANIATVAQGGTLTLFAETKDSFSFGSGSFTHRLRKASCTQAGVVSSLSIVVRSLGLASKAFLMGSSSYVTGVYSSTNQSSYFLINSTGNVVSKWAYQNGYGYYTTGIPSVTVSSQTAKMGYVLKTAINPINKETNLASGTRTNTIFSQTGLNLSKVTFGGSNFTSAEIGQNLNMSGGFLLSYDGFSPTENNFFLYPDSMHAQAGSAAGGMTPQQYYYQAVYAWTDNQGNVFRSAPSLPLPYTVGSAVTSVFLFVPSIKVTYKTINPIKCEIYRWSTAQQNYYQVTSIALPLLNDRNIDALSFVDTLADNQVIGNSLLYTTGGVIENTAAPAAKNVCTFDSRLWLIDAENPNNLWFSKPILQNTPVEMSDLQTKYIDPNVGAQGDTGPMTCIAPMDDKLVVFKKNAIYFINGRGPDITGANDQYSEPTFIVGTIGCENQNSIVLIPQGLMFQSDKGIWLLGRDLSTSYIGDDIDNFKTIAVKSSLVVPGTNEVRFTMDNGQTLMYDYFVDQWSIFDTIAGTGTASTLYEGLHTYLSSDGSVFQENPGSYLDGSNPVLLSFKTGWINLAGLQGYKRAYYMFLLANYISPHRLTAGIAYDYDESVVQLSTIVPDNYSGPWGSGSSWGSVTTWGGNSAREQWQVNFERQQCQSFQISLNEYYDSTMGEAAGAGFTMSGINMVAGMKSSYPKNIKPRNRTS